MLRRRGGIEVDRILSSDHVAAGSHRERTRARLRGHLRRRCALDCAPGRSRRGGGSPSGAQVARRPVRSGPSLGATHRADALDDAPPRARVWSHVPPTALRDGADLRWQGGGALAPGRHVGGRAQPQHLLPRRRRAGREGNRNPAL